MALGALVAGIALHLGFGAQSGGVFGAAGWDRVELGGVAASWSGSVLSAVPDLSAVTV